MIPIYRQVDIKTYDEELKAAGRIDEAIERAGYAIFQTALRMLGGAYGKRVVVIYGPGNNGRDALVAAGLLRRSGVLVKEVPYEGDEYSELKMFQGIDLIVDGCFGMGISRSFTPPAHDGGAKVLAVDLPSGLDGDSGQEKGNAIHSRATVNLSGVKLGSLIGRGPDLCGDLYVAGLGLEGVDMPNVQEYLIDDFDLLELIGKRNRNDNKWSHSVAVVAGSPGMDGAAHLVCTSAYLSGAGIVHLYTDSEGENGDYGVETVVHRRELNDLDLDGKTEFFQNLSKRFKSMVVGPGLGSGRGTQETVAAALASDILLVIDAEGIGSIPSLKWLNQRISTRSKNVVLTPHGGELTKLLERSSGSLLEDLKNLDTCTFARRFASQTGATLLVKGGPTVIADPDGTCYVTSAPSSSLAIAGSGDVLSGMIGALVSYEGDFAKLVALAAHLHGLAGRVLSRGLSGELPYVARDVFLRLIRLDGTEPPRTFDRAIRIEGNLVAREELVGDLSHGSVYR